MRYREGTLPESGLSGNGTEGVLIFTLVLGIVFGFVLLGLGAKGKQLWLILWSFGLILVSIVTLLWLTL